MYWMKSNQEMNLSIIKHLYLSREAAVTSLPVSVSAVISKSKLAGVSPDSWGV